MAELGSGVAKKARTSLNSAEGADAVLDAAEDSMLDELPSVEEDEELETELRTCQTEIDDCQAELMEKLRRIEAEYELKKRPLYKARGQVVRKIPGFWLHCFMQHHRVRYILGTVDQDILSSLTELEVENLEEGNSGYRIRLHFTPNSSFEDEVLEKEIHFHYEDGQPVLCSVTGCSPKWKDKDPTQPEDIPKGKKRGRDSTTFFRWFTQEKTFEPGLVDTLADIIKDQIYLNPLTYLDNAGNQGDNDGQAQHDSEMDQDQDELVILEDEPNGRYTESGSDRDGSHWGTEEGNDHTEDDYDEDGSTEDPDLREPHNDLEEELPDYEEGDEDERADEGNLTNQWSVHSGDELGDGLKDGLEPEEEDLKLPIKDSLLEQLNSEIKEAGDAEPAETSPSAVTSLTAVDQKSPFEGLPAETGDVGKEGDPPPFQEDGNEAVHPGDKPAAADESAAVGDDPAEAAEDDLDDLDDVDIDPGEALE